MCLAASVTAEQSGQYFKTTMGHSGTHYLFNDEDVNNLPIMQFYSVLGVSMDTVYGMNLKPDSYFPQTHVPGVQTHIPKCAQQATAHAPDICFEERL